MWELRRLLQVLLKKVISPERKGKKMLARGRCFFKLRKKKWEAFD